MDAVAELNTYRITYKTVSPKGIIGVVNNTSTIEAQNNDDAINLIRLEALSNGNSGIRVVKIQNLDEPPKQEIRKRKSILGWVFSIMFIGGMLAKLATKLF